MDNFVTKVEAVEASSFHRVGRLIFISHQRHQQAVPDLTDDDVFVVSNWRLWQQISKDGSRHLHFDHGLLGWDAYEDGANLFLDAGAWVYSDGRDVSEFDGISIGRRLANRVAIPMAAHRRIARVVDTLISALQPQSVVLFDVRPDDGFLSADETQSLVAEICRKQKRELMDHFDPLVPGTRSYTESIGFVPPSISKPTKTGKINIRKALRSFIETVLPYLNTSSLGFHSNRKDVLLLTTALTGMNFLNQDGGTQFRVVYPSARFPISWRRLVQAISNGVRFVSFPDAHLTEADMAAIERIRLRMLKNVESYTIDTFPVQSVKNIIQDGSMIIETVSAIRRMKRFFDKQKIAAVIFDGLRNALDTVAVEIARQRGIPVFASWHSPYLQDTKIESLGCDERVRYPASHCLSWGATNEAWLKAIGATVKPLRVGSLLANGVFAAPKESDKWERVLVVQYFMSFNDFRSPASQEYEYFVEVISMLRRQNITKIRFKLHPGANRTDLYKCIARDFGIDVEFRVDGPFSAHVDWADFIIGPAYSGTMLEVMSAGKPYFPILLEPTSMDRKHLDGMTFYGDYTSLSSAVAKRRGAEYSTVLTNFTSLGEIPRPTKTAWKMIANEL